MRRVAIQLSAAIAALLLALVQTAALAAQPAAEKPALENVHRLTPNILSGGQPHNDAAFSKLAELGVRTIVSVDGAKPDVAAAKRHGLRYVHIPIGYDGIDVDAQGTLTRLIHEVKGPIFIHCHHGKHRGPAAAAVACLAAGDMTRSEAADFMKLAGTGKEYAGLWRDVAAFKPLAADAKLPPLVETAEVDSLAAAMAELDRAWDGLKLCRDAAWQTPKDHADLAPPHQALLVWEALRESRRTVAKDDPQMAAWLDLAIRDADAIRAALKANRLNAATVASKRLENTCLRCHAERRN